MNASFILRFLESLVVMLLHGDDDIFRSSQDGIDYFFFAKPIVEKIDSIMGSLLSMSPSSQFFLEDSERIKLHVELLLMDEAIKKNNEVLYELRNPGLFELSFVEQAEKLESCMEKNRIMIELISQIRKMRFIQVQGG